jgi:hypothetical protein
MTQKDRHREHWAQETERRHTPPKKIDTGNIGHKTQKEDRDRTKKIDTGNIGHKTKKEDTDPTKKDRHGEHWAQNTERRHTPPKKIDTGNIGHKTQKEKTDPTRKDRQV